MADDDDFIVVKGKLPKTNKDGSPTVGHLGAGGLGRDDGTVESLVQDLEPLDDDAAKSMPLGDVPDGPRRSPERYRDELARAAVEGVVAGIGSGISSSIREATGTSLLPSK